MADRAPGSTVLRMVTNGMNLLNIEVETNWSADEITELAIEEGYVYIPSRSRFAKASSPEAAALATVTPVPIVTPSMAGTSGVYIDLAPKTDDGTASAPQSAPAGPTAAAFGAAVPSSPDSGAVAEGEAAAAPGNTEVGFVEHVLSAARGTGDPVLMATAEQIRLQVEDLARQILNHADKAEALAEVARLEAELAEARERAGLGPATPSPAPFGPTPDTVRAWAKDQGMVVSPRGRLPKYVLVAFNRAHGIDEGAAA